MPHPDGAGSYYRPQPVDFLILELLPEVGTIGGIHWKGRRAKDVRQDILDQGDEGVAEVLTMPLLQARLRALSAGGHVKNYGGAGTGGGSIWARTPDGTVHLARRDEVLG